MSELEMALAVAFACVGGGYLGARIYMNKLLAELVEKNRRK